MRAAFGLAGTDLVGQFTDAGDVAAGLARAVGPAAGDLFALFLLDAAIIGAAAVTLATSYAFGDVFGIRHSLLAGLARPRVSTAATRCWWRWRLASCSSRTRRSG